MAVYEEDFYKAENLEGCIRDAHGDPRILLFKEQQTNTIGRIVLHPEDPSDPFENIGRSVVFAEATHGRTALHNPFTNPPSTLTEERVGLPTDRILLYRDTGAFEPVTDGNRQELTNLIDHEQGLMEGHKGILKVALDIFDPQLGLNAIPNGTSEVMKAIMTKSHNHIVKSNQCISSRANQARANLAQWTQNPPPIALQRSAPVVVNAYPEFHAPYGQQPNVPPNLGGGVEAQHFGPGEEKQEDIISNASLQFGGGSINAYPHAQVAAPPPPSSLFASFVNTLVVPHYPPTAHGVDQQLQEASVGPSTGQEALSSRGDSPGISAPSHQEMEGRGTPTRGFSPARR